MPFGFLKRGARPEAPDGPGDAPGTGLVPIPAAAGAGAGTIRVFCMGPSQEMRWTEELLAAHAIEFEVVDASADPTQQSWVQRHTGSREYPQVFRGERLVGDLARLRKLDLDGDLERVLAGLEPRGQAGDDGSGDAAGDGAAGVRVRLRRGDVLSLTTPDGETFDAWAEIYANPPQVYYRGEPRPVAELDGIAAEIAALLADPRTAADWSAGR